MLLYILNNFDNITVFWILYQNMLRLQWWTSIDFCSASSNCQSLCWISPHFHVCFHEVGSILKYWSIHCMHQTEHRVINFFGNKAALSCGYFLLPTCLHFLFFVACRSWIYWQINLVEGRTICYAKLNYISAVKTVQCH